MEHQKVIDAYVQYATTLAEQHRKMAESVLDAVIRTNPEPETKIEFCRVEL